MSLSIQYYLSEAVSIKLTDNNIVVTWRQPLTESAQRQNCLKALVIARNCKFSRWLIDVRVLGKQFNENIIWTVREFFPSLLPFNESVTSIAYLLNKPEYERIVRSNGNSPVMAQGSLLQIELFQEMEPAKKWLSNERKFHHLRQA